MKKVLITGATGFIGSHIVDVLLENEFEIFALKRNNSSIWRTDNILVNWIDLNGSKEWKEKIIEIKPTIIIHCAWIGVESNNRDNLSSQIKNLEFLADLLEVTHSLIIHKFICLGSQAEYGLINGKINENTPTLPLNIYGGVKLAALQVFKTFCQVNNINWIWLRVFSIMGEKENESWLIPSVIKNIKSSKEMNLTGGDQKYSYMYVKDFAKIMLKIINSEVESGIYNVSSNDIYSLKYLIEKIRDKMDPTFKLNFGALKYRKGQSMHIEGDMSKLNKQIGSVEFTNIDSAIENILNHFMII